MQDIRFHMQCLSESKVNCFQEYNVIRVTNTYTEISKEIYIHRTIKTLPGSTKMLHGTEDLEPNRRLLRSQFWTGNIRFKTKKLGERITRRLNVYSRNRASR